MMLEAGIILNMAGEIPSIYETRGVLVLDRPRQASPGWSPAPFAAPTALAGPIRIPQARGRDTIPVHIPPPSGWVEEQAVRWRGRVQGVWAHQEHTGTAR
jgi:hypothetical protein